MEGEGTNRRPQSRRKSAMPACHARSLTFSSHRSLEAVRRQQVLSAQNFTEAGSFLVRTLPATVC